MSDNEINWGAPIDSATYEGNIKENLGASSNNANSFEIPQANQGYSGQQYSSFEESGSNLNGGGFDIPQQNGGGFDIPQQNVGGFDIPQQNVGGFDIPQQNGGSQNARPTSLPPRQRASRSSNNVDNKNIQQSYAPQPTPPQKNNVKVPRKIGKSKFPIILGIIILVLIVGVVILLGGKKKEPDEPVLVPQTYDYNSSGRYAYDKLLNALLSYDATTVDSVVGSEEGDSYLAQEWAYVNGVRLREEFILKLTSMLKFEYPKVNQMSTTGVVMTDEVWNPIMVDSYMNNNELVTVTIPDWYSFMSTMEEDTEYITRMFKSAGYSIHDYDWHNEMTNLMLQYICDKPSLPIKKVQLSLPIGINLNGEPYVKDDAILDDVLFADSDMHAMCELFSKICLEYDGYKDEVYIENVEIDNPEYAEWLKLFLKYYNEDNGKFNKRTSKWEPWYLRDENNQYIYDENGEKIVNYYSVKDENGNDWIEPQETIFVPVEKTRKIKAEWNNEDVIMYNWIGTHFLQTDYDGRGSTVVRVGDGSKSRPAGIGTDIITKVLCTNGKYADIKVAMTGYWTGKDAIEYAEKFSSKNRGFSTTSVVQLITFELLIENLTAEPIEFISEMTLADANSNLSSRTGTVYGFSEVVTLGPGEQIIINDWATSTELQQKYACWGKSFGRDYNLVYFDCLAGTGVIPPYSAYEQFTGKSSLQ